jgi:hypothetical protein
MWVQIAFLALFLAALLFSVHGVPPDPERHLTAREAYIPIFSVVVLATLGLAQWPRWSNVIVGISVVLGVVGGYLYIHRQATQPEALMAYRLATFLDENVKSGQRVLILSVPVSEESIKEYLDWVRHSAGEASVQDAKAELEEMALGGPDYQKVLVHSRLGRDRLLWSDKGCAEWLAVCCDYPGAQRELSGKQPVAVLQSESLSVSVIRRDCSGEKGP